MFARKVTARLKPNSLREFTNLVESAILPWLHTQKGFLDLITLVAPDGSEVTAISFWDHREDAQAYNYGGYPQVLKLLGDLLDSSPYVKTFEVITSTLESGPLAAQSDSKRADRGVRIDRGPLETHG
jgi:hypothetical protein